MERWRILHKESDFTIIDNGIFRDPDLTLAERGFLCTVLALPESWGFSVRGIVGMINDGRDSTYAVVNRLIQHGYCKREKKTDPKTRRITGYDYTFYEVKNGVGCASIPYPEKPDTEKPYTGFPDTENQDNIKYYNNKVLNISSTEKKEIYKERFDFLTALIGIGVAKETAQEWLQVRKTKRLTNTRIAFDKTADEILKSGMSAEECIRICVENSWGGCKAEWMPAKREEVWHGSMDDYLKKLKADGTL